MDYQVSIISRDDTVKPLDLDGVKRDLDVTFDDDNALIQEHIDSAIDWVENYTGLYMVPVVLRLYTGCLPAVVRLPRGPIRSVNSVSVDGVAITGIQTIEGSSYAVLPPISQRWPYTANRIGSVIEYQAGYAAGTVPAGLLAAAKAVVSIYYDKPSGNELTAQWAAVERMLSTYRRRSL